MESPRSFRISHVLDRQEVLGFEVGEYRAGCLNYILNHCRASLIESIPEGVYGVLNTYIEDDRNTQQIVITVEWREQTPSEHRELTEDLQDLLSRHSVGVKSNIPTDAIATGIKEFLLALDNSNGVSNVFVQYMSGVYSNMLKAKNLVSGFLKQ